MDYLRCPGTISQASGVPSCSEAWQIVPASGVESIWQPLTMEDGTAIATAIVGIWAVAFGIRFIFRFLYDTGPGRF